MMVRTLFTILTFTLCITANATNYYFSDSQGDDSRSSTEAQNPSTPWQSLAKLNSFFPYLQPGDHVYLKSGDVFYGSITTTKSGTSSSPIVISSYGDGVKPGITGFVNASGWDNVGGGIYESDPLPAGSTVNSVTINNRQYAMGRYPNADDDNGGYLTFESHGRNYITDNENGMSSSWEGAQIIVRTSHGSIERSTVTDVSGPNISYSPSFDHSLTDKFGYFVQNSIKALDQFGEWYYNPDNNRLYVYFGSKDPSSYAVKVSTIDILLTVHSSNIEVDDIRFGGANKYSIYNDLKGIDNLHINNCRIVYSGIDAIALAGTSDFLLENSIILNSNSNGIDLYYANDNAVIRTSTIQNTATFPGMLISDVGNRYGMTIYSSEGLTVLNNNLINSGWIPINYTGDNNLIQNNYIDTFCTVVSDGAGIYTFGGKSNPNNYNRKVIGNIVLNGLGARAGTYSNDPNYNPAEGIYFDDNSTNVEVTGNTVANCADAGIYVHNARGINLRNNILYNNYIQLAFQHDPNGNGVHDASIKKNQLFSKSSSQLVMFFQSMDNDFDDYGTFDSNYYCRPFNENSINFTSWSGHADNYYNLSQWQSNFDKDWHTKRTPIAVTDPEDILFQYNATNSTKTVRLNGNYVGLNSVAYSGSVDLAPYTSIILLRTSGSKIASTSNMSASAAAKINTGVSGPGYVNGEAALAVKAYPNPSSYYFNVTTQGSTTEPMTLRVIDLSGKLVQTKTGISANTTLQIGQDLAAGSYILELIQGNKKVEQKLIKLSK